jgi:hypothetical protein
MTPTDTTGLGSGDALFYCASGEQFQDGYESNFSRDLDRFLARRPQYLAALMEKWVTGGLAGGSVICEALRWCGSAESRKGLSWRRSLLQRCLRSKSAAVRDSAGLGLAYLGDRRAIPFLQAAISAEKNDEVSGLLKQSLAELESSS